MIRERSKGTCFEIVSKLIRSIEQDQMVMLLRQGWASGSMQLRCWPPTAIIVAPNSNSLIRSGKAEAG